MPDLAPRPTGPHRCEMTASWSAESENTQRPPNWVEQDGQLYCLSCRREIAAEEGLDALPEDASRENRRQARSEAPDPVRDRARSHCEDNRIAKPATPRLSPSARRGRG